MSIETLSPRGRQLLNAIRINFELLKEHDKESSAEVNTIVAAMIDHVRNFRPAILSSVLAPEVSHG